MGDPQVGEVGAWPPSQPLLTCNNLPDSGGGHHACAGVRAATAAPWPVSAAPPTGRAWPAAGGPPTWGVGWPQAGLGGRGCLPNTEQPLRQEGQDEAGKELGSGGSFPRGRARSHLTGREHRSRAPARLQERSAAPGPPAPGPRPPQPTDWSSQRPALSPPLNSALRYLFPAHHRPGS